MSTEIICKQCNDPKSEDDFFTSVTRGKKYRKKICKTCDVENRKQRGFNQDVPSVKRNRVKQNARLSYMRKNELDLARFIIKDNRGWDKKHGFVCDLTREFVEQQITQPCSYCGETELRMTLDRVDNTKGHSQDNVVPACIRCNYLRRDMPYLAWIEVAKGVQKAREQNLFGNWTGRVR